MGRCHALSRCANGQVATRFSGAGRLAFYTLSQRLPPPPAIAEQVAKICDLAVSRGVRLLFDAEQQAIQWGIDDWTLLYMDKYNTSPGRATIYGTYQAYLRRSVLPTFPTSCGSRISGHTMNPWRIGSQATLVRARIALK